MIILSNPPLHTDRLELIPATCEILTADLNSQSDLSRILGAAVPPLWPPPLMEGNVISEFLRMKEDPSGPLFATWYWILEGACAEQRTLIGSGGILQADGHTDTAVLGYSVLEEFWNRGYATEAVRALIPELFAIPGIRRIIAATYPELRASVRVLEKNGFERTRQVLSGTGAEEGSVCYVLEKPDEV